MSSEEKLLQANAEGPPEPAFPKLTLGLLSFIGVADLVSSTILFIFMNDVKPASTRVNDYSFTNGHDVFVFVIVSAFRFFSLALCAASTSAYTGGRGCLCSLYCAVRLSLAVCFSVAIVLIVKVSHYCSDFHTGTQEQALVLSSLVFTLFEILLLWSLRSADVKRKPEIEEGDEDEDDQSLSTFQLLSVLKVR
jgi:hypothetical protein